MNNLNMSYKILIWVILNYGLMNIVVFGMIFDPIRNFFDRLSKSKYKIKWIGKFLSEMTSCPMCFSTWGGFFTSLVIWSPTYALFDVPIFISWFFDGIIASGSVWIINSIIEFFEESRLGKKNDE